MLKLKFQYFGHLMGRAHSLEKILMLEKIECKRSGWQRMRCSDRITDSVKMNVNELQEILKDRGAWCASVHGIQKAGHDLVTEPLNHKNYMFLDFFILFFNLCSLFLSF